MGFGNKKQDHQMKKGPFCVRSSNKRPRGPPVGFPGGGDGGQKVLVGCFEIMFPGWLTRPSPLGF